MREKKRGKNQSLVVVPVVENGRPSVHRTKTGIWESVLVVVLAIICSIHVIIVVVDVAWGLTTAALETREGRWMILLRRRRRRRRREPRVSEVKVDTTPSARRRPSYGCPFLWKLGHLWMFGLLPGVSGAYMPAPVRLALIPTATYTYIAE
ncbi:hypothetical protein LZ30DRAFT_720599 [Colletotrichum cereale]|nr:hypothetical protein LZ30DRAFT_720599 [Colletotrichum cereale]